MQELKEFFIDRSVYVFGFFSGNLSLFITKYVELQETITLLSAALGLLTQFFSLLLAVFSFVAIVKKGTFEKFASKILNKFIKKQ
jgi:uncharacterized membrane protein YphA (DoxX/SURF4 family)